MDTQKIFEIIKNFIIEILPEIDPTTISTDKHLKDYGLNSIDRLEVITMTMEELDVKIPLVDFAKVKNINELIQLFHQNI